VLLVAGVVPFGGDLLAAPGDVVFERKWQGTPEGAVESAPEGAPEGTPEGAPEGTPEGAPEGADAFPPSIFQHWVHRIRYRCYVCHETLFKMKRGANAVTMNSINAGQHCGACHNGAVAFTPDFTNCSRCHREPEG
jgi:c(7)-type cytochrome triheme protein